MSELKIVEGNNLMTPQEAADYLKIKLSTIYDWTYKKILPCCKMGRLNRYRKVDLDNFISSNMTGVKRAD